MGIKCSRCGDVVDVDEMFICDGDTVCPNCNVSNRNIVASNTSICNGANADIKKYEFQDISVEISDGGFKEIVDREGVELYRFFTITVCNCSNLNLEWISFDVITQQKEVSGCVSSYMKDGSTVWVNPVSKNIKITKKTVVVNEIIKKSTISCENFFKFFRCDSDIKKNFLSVDLYCARWKFLGGDAFNKQIYKEKYDFRKGCDWVTIEEPSLLKKIFEKNSARLKRKFKIFWKDVINWSCLGLVFALLGGSAIWNLGRQWNLAGLYFGAGLFVVFFIIGFLKGINKNR